MNRAGRRTGPATTSGSPIDASLRSQCLSFAQPFCIEQTLEPRSIDMLLIEGSEIDALFVTRLLKANKELRFNLQQATTLAEAMPLLQTHDFDAVIVALCLPDAFGFEAFEQVCSVDARVPIIVVSGSDDEEAALHAIEAVPRTSCPKGKSRGRFW